MRRDPASLSRIMFTVVALLLLWPGLVITEFRPATLLDPNNLGTIGAFLGGFWPPELSQEFLALLAVATLQTLAMATAGLGLALIVAFPLSLVATRALSLSALGQRKPDAAGRLIRYPARLLMIILRSVPELGIAVRQSGWAGPDGRCAGYRHFLQWHARQGIRRDL